ncbi:MAG: hypothetical protein PHF57_08190 [Methanoregula sp.]|nr:hypothetical protein [Methanoregula sp.]
MISDFFLKITGFIQQYRVHLLVFLLALFLAITFAHPVLLITDEGVTTNQLAQLHAGHQVLVNEGKYGSYANGTIGEYFLAKNNYLAYPLFYPLISLPSYSLVDLFGENFVFAILYLWICVIIAIALLLNAYFPDHCYFGKWRWTTGLIIAAFVLFFVSLYKYLPFSVTGNDGFPEILAIVFTNVLLFAILAVMLFECNRTIFENIRYSFFATVVCISCSSYLFWTSYCKDHMLVACLFVAIVLVAVKYQSTRRYGFLAAAFALSGLLAWARPELALFVCLALCVYVVSLLIFSTMNQATVKEKMVLFFSPLFTLLGAIPFFINNYLFTKNILTPAWILWNTESTSDGVTGSVAVNISANVPVDTPGSIQALISIIQRGTTFQLSTFPSDLYGILFNPQSCSMGVFPLAPLFLVAILSVPVIILLKRIPFSSTEKHIIGLLLLLSAGVFFAYIRGIYGMNTSQGIAPDIRYLSPMYVPLTIIGLIVLHKIPIFAERSLEILKWMMACWIVCVPLSLFTLVKYYPVLGAGTVAFTLLDAIFSIEVYFFIALLILFIIGSSFVKIPSTVLIILVAIVCSLPMIWQIDATFIVRQFASGLGGYSFWIPAVRAVYAAIFLGVL